MHTFYILAFNPRNLSQNWEIQAPCEKERCGEIDLCEKPEFPMFENIIFPRATNRGPTKNTEVNMLS